MRTGDRAEDIEGAVDVRDPVAHRFVQRILQAAKAGEKFYAYTGFYENQARYVKYVDRYVVSNGVVPGQGRVKFLDNEVFSMYIRYIGKETIKTKYGRFRSLKLKPLLIKGEVFKGGEDMTVWVTDDDNHIPVRFESPIVVGQVKIDMMNYENIRHPLTSLIKRR